MKIGPFETHSVRNGFVFSIFSPNSGHFQEKKTRQPSQIVHHHICEKLKIEIHLDDECW